MSEIDKAAKTHLGQSGSYAVYTDKFDPSLLVRMPRAEAREMWNVDAAQFVGVDVWRAYESTFLLNNGLPVSGTLKIVCPADSEYMVESKSLKLYLNTFDMCKMGDNLGSAIRKYKAAIADDLTRLLGKEIKVGFFTEALQYNVCPVFQRFQLVDLLAETDSADIFNDYSSKEDHLRFSIKSYAEKCNDSHVQGAYWGAQYISTNLLRSRCRHTKQKDSGSAYLFARADREITPMSFLKQIVSMREINEFHEFCAEKIFSSTLTQAEKAGVQLTDLMIGCLYARRGGIDINPIRATSWDLLFEGLLDPNTLCEKTIMQ